MRDFKGEGGWGREGLSLVEIGFEVGHNGMRIGFDFGFWSGCLPI